MTTDDLTDDDDAPPIGAAYGYVAVPLPIRSIPYRGLVLAHFIEQAWGEVEKKMPNWRPSPYRVFVFSLLERPSEYQLAAINVKESGAIEMRKFPMPIGD